MSIDKFRAALHAAPFQPFTIHMADGRSLPVPHPDFVAVMPGGQTIIVVSPKEQTPSYFLVDVPLITELEAQGIRRKTDA